jgi:hypothetical protein
MAGVIIMVEEEQMFSFKFVVNKIATRECLLCEKNLDRDLKRKDWHIPLCKKHRIEYLDEISKELGVKNGNP